MSGEKIDKWKEQKETNAERKQQAPDDLVAEGMHTSHDWWTEAYLGKIVFIGWSGEKKCTSADHLMYTSDLATVKSSSI